MDHRKLLVIILSVAVFVALVLGIALLAYYPGDEPAPRARDERGDFDPIEYVRSGEDTETDLDPDESDDPDDDDLVIIYGSREADRREDRSRTDPDDDSGDDSATDESDRVRPLEDPEPREPVVRGGTRDDRETSRPRAPDSEAPTTSRDPAESGPAAESAVDSAEQPTGQDTSTETAPQDDGRPTREYWIQVISSPSRDTAESARLRLANRDFGSVIFPVSVGGDSYYRVRVGPYDNRNEAQKFLSWIQELDGFEQSYVSLVTRS